MTYLTETDNESHSDTEYPGIQPTSNSHFTLPLPGKYYAPQTFTGKPYELETFLAHYKLACERHEVTASEELYQGLTQYCSPKIIRTLRNLPSHKHKDYNLLVGELKYFYGDSQKTYNIAKVEEFTNKWRQRRMKTINQFKRYHRKYLELVGQAREEKKISTWDYNRYFWEGLHETFRNLVEGRMLTITPDLDVSTPFSISKVVTGAEHILSPHRFDQHLFIKPGNHSSDTEPESDPTPKRRKPKKESSSEDDSMEDELPPPRRKPYTPPRTFPPSQPSFPTRPPTGKSKDSKSKEDDIKTLVTQLSHLEISDPQYRVLYVDLIRKEPNLKDAFDRPARRQAPRPFLTPSRPPPPPQQFPNRPPPPPQQFPNRFTREIPPHQNPNNIPISNPATPDTTCFGCGGKDGHSMRYCEELNGLIRTGRVVKNQMTGKLQWPDGSRIVREYNEPWAHAIKNVKQANFIQVGKDYQDSESVYNYTGVMRESDDASTDEQAELGWTSGEVADRHTFGVERAERISKETRRKVQLSPPDVPKRMKKLPERRKEQGSSRQQTPIPKNVHFDSNHARDSRRPIPVDPDQDEFKGQADDQFLPMDVDKQVSGQPTNNLRKKPPHQNRTHIPKVSDPGPTSGKDSVTMANEILDGQFTLKIRDIIGISPILRRELSSATKQVREAPAPTQEKTGLVSGLVPYDDSDDEEEPWCLAPALLTLGPAAARDALIKLPVTIGNATMTGIYDSGSQVNLISENMARQAGLPWLTDRDNQLRLISVDKTVSVCEGKIPQALMFMAENKRPTFGELHVKKNTGFDLLLGRTWSTANVSSLEEKPEGTILSWLDVQGERQFRNVCPSDGSPPGPVRTEYSDDEFTDEEITDNEAEMFAAAIAKDADIDEEAPDSEEIYEGPTNASMKPEVSTPEIKEREADFEYSPVSIDDDFPTPAQRRHESLEERASEEDQESDDRPNVPTPRAESGPDDNASPTRSESGPDTDAKPPAKQPSRETCELNESLHEDYIKMVQNGASNDEWKAFCVEEERKLKKNKKRWVQMKNADDMEEDFEHYPTIYEDPSQPKSITPSPSSTHEPSQTLQTPPSSSNRKRKLESKADHRSVITTARRTKRVRRLTEKAKGDEYQNFIRSYQRSECQWRTSVQGKGQAIDSTDLYACLANVLPGTFKDDDDGAPEPYDPSNTDLERCGGNLQDQNQYLQNDPTNPESNPLTLTSDSANVPNPLFYDSPSEDESFHSLQSDAIPGQDDQAEKTTAGEELARATSSDDIRNPLTCDKSPSIGSQHDGETREPGMKCHTKEENGRSPDRDDQVPVEHQPCSEARKEADPPLTFQSKEVPEGLDPITGEAIIRDRAEVLAPEVSNKEEARPLSNDDRATRIFEGQAQDQESEHESEDGMLDVCDNEVRSEEETLSGESEIIPFCTHDPSDDCTSECGEGGEEYARRLEGSQQEEYLPPEDDDVPESLYVPTALLAAIEILPYTCNAERGEYTFKTYGTTLSTEDRDGNPVFFHGDALIRIKRPPAVKVMKVPRRDRTNEMRERLFWPARYEREHPPPPDEQPPQTITPAGHVASWYNLESEELETMFDELKANPFDEEEVMRAYTMSRNPDGIIIIQQGFVKGDGSKAPVVHVARDQNLKRRDKDQLIDETEPTNKDASRLTEKGRSNPHQLTPDQLTRKEDGAGSQYPTPARNTQTSDRTDNGEACDTCQTKEELGQELERSSEKLIKEKEPAQTKNSPPLETSGQTSTTTASSNNGQCSCRCSMCPCSNPNVFQPERVVARQTLDRAEIRLCEPQSASSEPTLEQETVISVPTDCDRSQGSLTAPHIIRLTDEPGDPGPNLYFAYNATVEFQGVDGQPFAQQGHALVRLYSSSSDSEYLHDPDDRSRRLRIRLIRYPRSNASTPEQPEISTNIPQSLETSAMNPLATPFVPKEVSVVNQNGDEMSRQDAIDGLRALKTGVVSESDGGKERKLVDLEESDSDDSPQYFRFRRPATPDLEPGEIREEPPRDEHGRWFRTILRRGRPYQPCSEDERTPSGPTYTQPRPDTASHPIDGPPPDLQYPDSEGSSKNLDVDDPMDGNQRRSEGVEGVLPSLAAINMEGDLERPAKVEKVEMTKESPVDVVYRNLDILSGHLGRAVGEEKRALMAMLEELGLLQVTYDLAKAKADCREIKVDLWKKTIVDVLRAKQNTAVALYTQKLNPSDEERDVEMITHPEPSTPPRVPYYTPPESPTKPIPIPVHAPPTPPEWYPDVDVPPYVPNSPDPNDMILDEPPYAPRSPIRYELEDVKERLANLESEVAMSTNGLRDRIRDLENTSFTDGNYLTQLKWEVADLKKDEEAVKSSWRKNKRSEKENAPSHRYPTRYSKDHPDRKLADIHKSIGELTKRIRTLEAKIGETKKEVRAIQEKMAQVLELGPRFEELSRKVEEQRKAQTDHYSMLLSEVSDIRLNGTSQMEGRFKQQAAEISSLNNRFMQLRQIATQLLYVHQTTTNDAYTAYTQFFSNAANPNQPKVTAF